MTRRIVSVWLRRWPLDRLSRTEDGRPPEPAIAARTVGQRRLVVCVSEAAEAAGLRTGMTVALAQASVPGLTVVEADEAADEAALERLALWALRYTPLCAADHAPAGPADGLVLDVTGAAHLMGGETALLSDLLVRLRRAGLSAEAAMADSRAAAWALARYAPASEGGRLSAPGRAAADCAPLRVAGLGLGEGPASAMMRLGMDRIGQLMAAPRTALGLRFGAEVTRRLAEIAGTVPEPFEPVIPAETPRTAMRFQEPIGHTNGVEGALARLLNDLCTALEKRALGVRTLDLYCHRVDGEVFALRVRCAAPSRAPDHLARLFRERTDRIDPGFGIERMVLAATRAEPLRAEQLGAGETHTDLRPLVDRVAARVGQRAVFRVVPTESDVPERACRRVPALDGPTALDWDRGPRPIALIEPPAPAQVLALLPDHPPARFTWRGGTHRVVRADGPECVLGEWWRADEEVALTRDYYRVEDEAGSRFWLFRARDEAAGSADWFVHGAFG